MAEPRPIEGEFSCAICLDLLKQPVTSSCGHSYCVRCIKQQWDEEDERKMRICPLCRKDTMLTYSMEQLKLMRLQDGRDCIAALGDVACDICTQVKLKATKFCLQCLASYCNFHLLPHNESHPFHKLIKASVNSEEYICSRHNEVMQMFCRTEDQSICSRCSMEEHKGHDTVSAAAERTERQKYLGEHFIYIQQKIQDRQKDVMVLQNEMDAIDRSTHKAVRDSRIIFSKLAQLINKRSVNVIKQIISQQQTQVSRTKELQDRLEQEITELRKKRAELERILRTEDDTLFLRRYHSLSQFSGYPDSPSINIHPARHFEDLMTAVSELRDKLQAVLSEEWIKISLTEVDALLPQPEPETKNQFLKLSCQITLDPDTANKQLLLSEGNRKATWMFKEQSYSDHPQRFAECLQVLSRESLTGRCYWEVDWSGFVSLAVAYKNICRTGRGSQFGENDKSWALDRLKNEFRHNSISTSLSVNLTSKIGVYLDRGAGILSFYGVSETMTLLHRVRVAFSEPLHIGLCVCWESMAELCQLR